MFLIMVSKHLNCSLGPMSAMFLDQKGPYWPPVTVSDIFGQEGTLLEKEEKNRERKGKKCLEKENFLFERKKTNKEGNGGKHFEKEMI